MAINKIEGYDEPWNKIHDGDDVEEFLKEKLQGAEARLTLLEGGVSTRCTVFIEGSTAKSYGKGATDVRFQYRVDNTVNDAYDSNFVVYIEVNGHRLEQRPMVGDKETLITSPNVAPWLKQNTGVRDDVTIWVENGSGGVSSKRSVAYTCLVAKVRVASSFNVSHINPTALPYIAEFTASVANLEVTAMSVTGGEERNYTLNNIRSSEVDVRQVSIAGDNAQVGIRVADAKLLLGNNEGESEAVRLEYINVSQTFRDSKYVAVMPMPDAVQYEETQLRFGVYNAGEEEAAVHVTIYDAKNEVLYDNDVECVCSTLMKPTNGITQSIAFRATTDTGRIEFRIGEQLVRSYTYSVKRSEIDWEVTKEGLVLYLTAMSRKNSETEPATWKYNGRNYAKFSGVEFPVTLAKVMNGWMNERTLHLTGLAKATITHNPFYDTTPYEINRTGGGIYATGRSFIIKFRTSDIVDENTECIRCWDPEAKVGFIIRPTAIFAQFGNKLVDDIDEPQTKATNNRRFAPNTDVEVCITIGKLIDNGQLQTPEIRMYVNGEIAAQTTYVDTTYTMSQRTAQDIVLGAVNGTMGCSLDVYYIRVYNRELTPEQVLRNHTMDMYSQNAMVANYRKNQYNINTFTTEKDIEGNYQGIFAYCAQQSRNGKPCAIVVTTDLRRGVTNTSDAAPGHQELTLYFFKDGEIDRDLSVRYVAAEDGGLRIRVQGTSTAFMPEKNLRYDARSKGVYEYRWNGEVWVLVEHPEDPNGDNRVYKLAIKLTGTDDIPCSLLTTKTNYNESTATRNLPSARWEDDALNALYDAYPDEYADLLTPPQKENRKVRQTINGVPAVQYYDKQDGSTPTFAGKVDIITDKSNQGVFGFTTEGDHSIEVRNNGSAQANFVNLDFTQCLQDQTSSATLEYRYPDIKTAWNKDYIKPDSPFCRFAKFVYDCSPHNVGMVWDWTQNKGVTNTTMSVKGKLPYFINEEGVKVYTLEIVDNVIMHEEEVNWQNLQDTEMNRRYKFYAELHEYGAVSKFVFDGLVTLTELRTDQRAKNQFFTSYVNDKVTDQNGVEHSIVRLLSYDIDTSKRGDNDSHLRYDFQRLYTDLGIYDDGYSEGGKVYQSALYLLLDNCFKRDYAKMFGRLSALGFLTFETMRKYYADEQAEAYSSTIINADANFKYLQIAEESEGAGATDQRFKAHGTALEDLDWWGKGRYYFMGGMFYDGSLSDYSKNAVNVELTDGDDVSGVKLQISSYVRNYVHIRYGGNNMSTRIYNEAYVDGRGSGEVVTADLGFIGTTGSADNRLYILGGEQIRSLGDMSRLHIRSIGGGNLNTVDMKIGSTASGYVNNSFAGFNTDAVYGACREVNVANCKRMPSLYLENFPVVETVEARGCDDCSVVTLPASDTIKTMRLPRNLTSLTLKNKKKLSTLSLEGTAKMDSIEVNGVSNGIGAQIMDYIA